jgi:hypothetical protein
MPFDGVERFYDPPPRPEREVPRFGELVISLLWSLLIVSMGLLGLVALLHRRGLHHRRFGTWRQRTARNRAAFAVALVPSSLPQEPEELAACALGVIISYSAAVD